MAGGQYEAECNMKLMVGGDYNKYIEHIKYFTDIIQYKHFLN
jgi:uncharacterized short protein YbdD (DUF466 family)